MAELGETTDPAALVPGDPAGVRAIQETVSRLGAALVGAGDGLRRIETGEWQGEAAEAFRRAFAPVPPQWTGTGEAFLQAADALADVADVLEWARGEAALAVQERVAADTLSTQPRAVDAPDPGESGRSAAPERLRAARAEVLAAGDRATPLVARARDLAPPAPSVGQQIGGFLGDALGGAWSELAATGQFLWQINPTRVIVEPAAAVEGWKDLGAGVANAVTHPQETIEQALNPRELATNPTRWAGGMLTGAGLSALGGAGTAGRVERATRAAGAFPSDTPDAGSDSGPVLGRYNGLTAAEHVARRGRDIGRQGSAKNMKVPTRELDTSEEVDEVFRELSVGGQVIQVNERVTVVLLEDGTHITWRPTAASTEGQSAVDINAPVDQRLKVHTPIVRNR